MAAELRAALAAAQAQAAAAEERGTAAERRVAAAEERHQQLEAALNESHASLQQRNAELALLKKAGAARLVGCGWGRLLWGIAAAATGVHACLKRVRGEARSVGRRLTP